MAEKAEQVDPPVPGDAIALKIGKSSGTIIIGGSNTFNPPEVPSTDNATFSAPVSWKYLCDTFDKAEKDGTEMNMLSNILNASAMKEIVCTMTTSYLSIEVEILSSFIFQFLIEGVGPTCKPQTQLRVGKISRLRAGQNSPKPLNEECFYKVDFWVPISVTATKYLKHFITEIYPDYEGIQLFAKLVEFVGIHIHEEAEQSVGETPLLQFRISYSCSDAFCAAMETVRFSTFVSVRMECHHSEITPDKIFEKTECDVDQICSRFLSKPNIYVQCTVYHLLRENQLMEFLLSENAEDTSLQVIYKRSDIHDKIVNESRIKRKLKKSNTKVLSDDRVVNILRPCNTERQRLLAAKLTENASRNRLKH